ncbi:tryptophan synthase subunit alpha [Myroides sp. LJL116]
MKNRITELFEKKDKNILSIFFTAGYPNLKDTTTIIKHLEQEGVDLIEIGIPFSDPLADGPVIQESSSIAIENGLSLTELLEQLKDIRTQCQIPIVLMGYLNPILQYGIEEFITTCSKIGIDGLIIPDLPLDFYKSKFESLMLENNLSNILLVSNQTSEQRILEIDKNSTGFIYMVSSAGVTGSAIDLEANRDYYQKIESLGLKNPRLIGFGVRDKQSFNAATKYSSGAIIGTAFIKHITQHGIDQKSIKAFINQIR